MESKNEDPTYDRAYGAVIGAFIADSCGSFNEFNRKIINEEHIMDHCMSMPGGGPFKLDGGQITDDSELALCLSHGLIDLSIDELPAGYNRENVLVMDNIAAQYGKWMGSNPFDIGITTSTSLSSLREKPQWKVASDIATLRNTESLSNGSLMRVTPMALYTSLLDEQSAREAINADVSMTHSNQVVKDTVYLYCLAIHYLIKNPNSKNRAHEAFDLVYEKSREMSEYYCYRQQQQNGPKIWLERAKELEMKAREAGLQLVNHPLPADVINCRKLEGWIERAFVLSFYYLLRHEVYVQKDSENLMYEQSIRQIIREGGDTDTNACIAGGMIGALIGINQIPKAMVQKIKDFDCTDSQAKKPRPEFLSSKNHIFGNIEQILKMRPKGKLLVIY